MNIRQAQLPQGWEIKSLGEIADVEYGFTDKSTEVGDYRYVRITDIDNNGELVSTDKKYLKKSKEAEAFLICDNDLLMARTGATFAKVLLYEDREPSVFASYLIRINFKEQIENKLYWYFTKTKFYWDQANRLASGAAQPHFNGAAVKQVIFSYPKSLIEQQRIVSILDECFVAIAKAKANAEQNLKNAKELFESYLQGVFENGNWETKTIDEVCDEIFAGGDAPKNNFSTEPNEKHTFPIYANAVKDRGLYGYTDFARVTKPCVTISARGSGTGHTELRNEQFLPIVRLIVCIPDTKQMSTEFLKYTIDNLVIQRSGSAIPQLTVPMIKDYKIPVPTIEEQNLLIEKAESLRAETKRLEAIYQQKLINLEELKKSLLEKAFAGELKTEKALTIE
jgi:type I restriction enzyme S subunit